MEITMGLIDSFEIFRRIFCLPLKYEHNLLFLKLQNQRNDRIGLSWNKLEFDSWNKIERNDLILR